MPAVAAQSGLSSADLCDRRLQLDGRAVRDQCRRARRLHAGFAARRGPLLHHAGALVLQSAEPNRLWRGRQSLDPHFQAAGSALGKHGHGRHGSGQSYNYTVVKGSGFAAPTNGAINSLQATAGGASFTETQPDGTLYQYGSQVSGVSPLLYIQNPAGARWTVTYDGSSRVSSITDPILRATTLTYNATSGKLSSILDPFGRLTTITVNSSGDLVQILSPELCLTSMVYDTNHLMLAWINPLGDRTSFTYGSGSQLVVTSPLGAVTTLTSGTQSGGLFRPASPATLITTIINPLGQVSTLGFDATQSMLLGAIDALGNTTTYNWDAHQRLAGIVDGLGNSTSFSYALFGTKVEG